ncbi:MAG: hypothetical protein LCH73_02810 [Proteobacteria bacterium]|nr:hypothetical protein [Pseudomonadota bacterium]
MIPDAQAEKIADNALCGLIDSTGATSKEDFTRLLVLVISLASRGLFANIGPIEAAKVLRIFAAKCEATPLSVLTQAQETH